MRKKRTTSVALWLTPLLAVVIFGCFTPRETQQVPDFFAQFPPISLSSERIHSPSGDMTALLPVEWISIDVEKLEDPEIFAVACNPDYTLSVVFNEVPLDNALRASFDQSGMRGLLEESFARRQRRSGGRVQEMQEIEQFAIGLRRFGAYVYTTDSAAQALTRVAVFFTNYHLYECTITHLKFSEHELPDPQTMRKIHQIILGGIEW